MGAADPSSGDGGGEGEGGRGAGVYLHLLHGCVTCLPWGLGVLWGPWGWPGTREHVCPPLPPPRHSQTQLKGLPEARPHSPNGFAFVPEDSRVRPSLDFFLGGLGDALSWSL